MRFFSKKRQKPSVELSDQSFILEPILTPSGIIDGSDDNDSSTLLLDFSSNELDSSIEPEIDSSPDLDIPDSPVVLDNLLETPLSDTEIETIDYVTSDADILPEIGTVEGVEVSDSEVTYLGEETSETEISDSPIADSVDEIGDNSQESEEVAIASTDSSDPETSDPVDTTSDIEIAPKESEMPSTEEISNDLPELATPEETEISNSEPSASSIESSDLEVTLDNDTSAVTSIDDLEGNLPENEIDSPDDSATELVDPILPPDIIPQTEFTFDSGVFTIGESGVVGIDFLFDGGAYKGELGMFSLEGMTEFEPGSEAFIQEAARRALSQSELGHVVISDIQEGAKFSAALPHEGNFNSGEYLGVKEFTMRAGDKVAFMLIPNGTVERIFANPGSGGNLRPLFSLATANPNDMFHAGQIADVTGEGNTFVFEDLRVDGGSDRDYNDIIFQVRGARGEATLMENVIDPAKDWRTSDMGQALLAYAQTYITPDPIDNGLTDVLAGLDDLDFWLNLPTEPELDIPPPGLPNQEVDVTFDNPSLGEAEASNPELPSDAQEPITGEPSETPEPIVEESSETISGDETAETPEASVEDSDSEIIPVDETPEASVEDSDSETDEASETPELITESTSETIPSDEILSEQQPESPSASIEADNSTPETQESDFPEYPAFEVPPAIPASEFVTRIETFTASLSNPEIASAVGTQADVIALTTRLERLTQTLSRQETVSFENAIAINNLLNRVEMLSYPPTPLPVTLVPPSNFNFASESQPLVGIIDTGFSGNNPDIDYSRVTWGRDWIDGDNDPTLVPGEGNEHGTHILGLIAAQRDNGIGIDGINPDAPIWAGRAVGSGKWAESLVEFVDAARESGQPNAVVNLSLDLTQIDAQGNITTRYELTPMERTAIEYARQNGVLLVVAAGNDASVMSALGQASQEFDNIITVGAAEQFDPNTSVWKGANRTDYSSYGHGLDITAYGGTIENPKLSLTEDGVGVMAGTSVATAKVTGAISQVWAANPGLNYRQVIDILKQTATDLGETGFDPSTGAGLLNIIAAVHLAKATKPENHQPVEWFAPEFWTGEGHFIPSDRPVNSANTGTVGTRPSLDRGTFIREEVSNGVTIRHYTNGYLMRQPNGHESWYLQGTGQPSPSLQPVTTLGQPTKLNSQRQRSFGVETGLLFYDYESGAGEMYATSSNGSMHRLYSTEGWRTTWDMIIPGDFGGGGYTNLLFYDRDTGEHEFYRVNDNGSMTRIRQGTGWRTTWDMIIPGNFGGGGYNNLLFYDRDTGEHEFYRVDNNGSMTRIRQGTGWRTTWDMIIPGDFNGDGKTDLLFYDRDTGEHEFYRVNNNGSMTRIHQGTGWRTTWDMIIPGDFNGDGKTDLLFYDRDTGEHEFYRVNNNGSMTRIRRDTGWRTTWDIVTSLGDRQGTYHLKPGSGDLEFRRGQQWVTSTGYKFIFQNDGNLVLYSPQGKRIWSTDVIEIRADRFVVQKDGNVVLYDGSHQIWATNTSGNPGAYLAIQGDGNLVVYSSNGKVLFSTGTHGGHEGTETASREWLRNRNLQRFSGLHFSTIISKATGQPKAMDGGGNNSSVYLHSSLHPNGFRQWGFEKVGDYYMIINKETGKALDGGGINGKLPYTHPDPRRNNPNQLWELRKVGEAYMIINKATGYALDAGGEIYMHRNPAPDKDFQLWELNLPNSGGNGGWHVPLDPGTYTIFPANRYRTPQRPKHNGIDLSTWSSNPYVPVKAAKSGEVIQVGYEPNGWGTFIRIQHADGLRTVYAHLSQTDVRVGDYVNGGQKIGNVGSTGNSDGPHLHFEVHVAPYRHPQDTRNPENYIRF
nr:S8 family serine peptidase [Desertifilum tharense]